VGLRVLITNNTLAARAGSELYVRDLALALLRRGHTPIAYSTDLGTVAEELRLATIPAVDDLRSLAQPPDIIHGQHHLDTMTALLHFPNVPCVYFCHGWLPWEEAAPRFPRIYQYVAVDHTCRDRLLYQHGIPENQIEVLLNFVDLERFQPRSHPLPLQPKRALVFSNAASHQSHLSTIQTACHQLGITVDVAGMNSGQICTQPEALLGNYDLVFAKARAALEAMSVGAAVILCDAVGSGALVTTANFDQLRPLNFGVRALQDPISVKGLVDKIGRYAPQDAAAVSQLIRATAGREAVVDQILHLYERVLERAQLPDSEHEAEQQATATYLRWLAPRLKQLGHCEGDRIQLHARLSQSEATLNRTQQDLTRTQQEAMQQQQHLQAEQFQQQQQTNQQQQTKQHQQAELLRHQQVNQHLQAELDHRQHINQALRTKLQRRQTHIQQLQTELAETQTYLAWMQTSKFWQVRNLVMKVMRWLGFQTQGASLPGGDRSQKLKEPNED
jgi:Glycosyltransferase Family 4